jgi:hypothetical protein
MVYVAKPNSDLSELFNVLLIIGMEQEEKLSRTISETFVKFVSFVVKS